MVRHSQTNSSKNKTTSRRNICLHVADPIAPKIVETDASDLGYGGILKQVQNNRENIVQFTSTHLNEKYYSTIKKEIFSIVMCITNFKRNFCLGWKKKKADFWENGLRIIVGY